LSIGRLSANRYLATVAATLSDPPRAWQALMEELALPAENAPPPPEEEPEPTGFLGRAAKFFRSVSPTQRAMADSDALNAALGLHITEMPQRVNPGGVEGHSYQEGETVMEGERFGRTVEMRIGADRYRTRLGGATRSFHVRSEDGRLVASEASPEEIREAIASLTPDERWEGVEAESGPEGVVVRHRVKGMKRKQEGLWYLDLWLAEKLAELAGPG
jgi:hypothetical protein